jgi:hypothetical protein
MVNRGTTVNHRHKWKRNIKIDWHKQNREIRVSLFGGG